MDEFGFDLLQANNDWTVPGIQAHADAVASNIEQSVAYLAPRAEALTSKSGLRRRHLLPALPRGELLSVMAAPVEHRRRYQGPKHGLDLRSLPAARRALGQQDRTIACLQLS